MFVGRDFFPIIDGGQIQLHVRVPAGTRIEKTEQIFQAVEDKIREVIPQDDRDLIVDNIGLPARSYNYAFGDGTAIGVNDGVILVALKEDHAPTATYIRKLREILPAAFPENIFYFQAADMVTQILNFGIPAQINVRTVGYDRNKNLRIAREMQQRIAAIPGVADVHLQQEVNGPEFFAQIDRARATQFGLTVSDIALNLNTSLSSSEQISPNFWTDPSNGTPYYLTVQTPEYRVASLNDLKNTPVTKFTVAGPQYGARAPEQRRHPQARFDSRPTPIRPTSSRSMKSMPMPTAGIWARSPATSARSSRSIKSNCRRAIGSRSSARSTA